MLEGFTGGEFKKFLKHYQLSKHFENFGKGWGGDRLMEDQFGTAHADAHACGNPHAA